MLMMERYHCTNACIYNKKMYKKVENNYKICIKRLDTHE